MAFRCTLSTQNKEPIWDVLRLALTIIGYVELELRNSYLNDEGKGFNSTLGECSSLDKGLPSVTSCATLARVGRTCGEDSNSLAHFATLRFSSLVVPPSNIHCPRWSLEPWVVTTSHTKLSIHLFYDTRAKLKEKKTWTS